MVGDTKLAGRGRLRRVENIKRIKLRQSTFQLWNQKQESLGHGQQTNSEFADTLLHNEVELPSSSVIELIMSHE